MNIKITHLSISFKINIMKFIQTIFLLFAFLNLNAQHHKKVKFTPSNYYSHFSAKTSPVLSIVPGDTVYTSSIDCDGFDKKGVKCSIGNAENPLTGPFFIEGAEEGDVVQITFTDVKFSRNTAVCIPFFHERSMPASITDKVKNNTNTKIIWDLDIKNKKASLQTKTAHLKNFTVDINPFLGCVGLAAPNNQEISTEDSGPFGGNMDFKKITKGATVYLPVFAKGGLLYIGDGHAAQGDGELNWMALETSLDYAFTTKVIKKSKLSISYPRVEDAQFIMTVGMDATLDNSLKIATNGMLTWLQEKYDLTIEEATQVMGSSIEYKITEIVDPKVEVVALIKKSVLSKINSSIK
jgi:amidase